MRECVAEFDHTQEVVHVIGGDVDVIALAFFHHLARDLAADIADLTLQISDTRFASVRADQRGNSFIAELDILFRQAGLQHLFLDQELLGDLDLFVLRVAVQAKDFHAVLQGGRNGVHHVGSGHEEDLGKVIFDVEVVIDEHKILFGIEHFEQRGRWVAAEVH